MDNNKMELVNQIIQNERVLAEMKPMYDELFQIIKECKIEDEKILNNAKEIEQNMQKCVEVTLMLRKLLFHMYGTFVMTPTYNGVRAD